MTTIAHLADLHFGRVDEALVEALIEDLRRQAPDLVAVSGDLTQAARNREFAAARAFLDRLGAPILAVPGNHDVSPYRLVERFLDPWKAWRRYIAPETEPIWTNGAVAVVGLNTARAIGRGLDWSLGRINRAQLERCAARFARHPGTFRILVAHHPLVAAPERPEQAVVARAALAIRRLSTMDVRLVLSGHLHLAFLRELSPEAIGPPERVAMVVQSRSATSTRLRGEPNGYNVIRVEGHAWAIESREWTGAAWRAASAADDGAPVRV